MVTDGWQGYHGIAEFGYTHARFSQRAARARGEDAGALLPGVHRVASLAKRWLLGTHQGSVEEAHLQSYLDEFVFRFNRRTSRSHGLVLHRVLHLAVGHEPVRYRDLVFNPEPKKHPPTGPAGGAARLPSTVPPPTDLAGPDLPRSGQVDTPEYLDTGSCRVEENWVSDPPATVDLQGAVQPERRVSPATTPGFGARARSTSRSTASAPC